MPLVVITANRARDELTWDVLRQFAERLQPEVAHVLTCDDEGGQLTRHDIEVEVRDLNPQRSIGGDQYDIRIVVLANDYPTRRADLFERSEQLTDQLQPLLPEGIHGFVWILLAPAAFVEF